MSDEQDAGEIGASMLAASSLPAYLRVEAQYGTIICTEHRTAYTPSNIVNHLVNSHKASKSIRDQVQEYLQKQNVAHKVTEPPHDSAPIVGLEIHLGWQCNVNDCNQLSQNRVNLERHSSKEHGFNSKRRREEAGVVVQVSMQRWFARSNKYWIVDFRSTPSHLAVTHPPSTPRASTIFASSPRIPLSSPPPLDHASQTSHPLPIISLSQSIQDATEKERQVARVFREAEHPSELTPWNLRSRYYEHFREVDMDLVAPALEVPRTPAVHRLMFYLAQSVRRVLQQAYREVFQLHPVVAKRLNTFEASRISQDPFTFLQNSESFQRYTATFQRLVCYFYRVAVDDHFERPMFDTTPTQQSAWEDLATRVETLRDYMIPQTMADLDLSDVDSEVDDPEREQLQSRVDQAMTDLLGGFVLHDTREDSFSSAIFSFCAASSWSRTSSHWMDENQSAGVLSQVIYCCQLVILAEARRSCTAEQDFVARITELCQTWLHNDAFGPMGDMLRLRLYAMRVASQVVQIAPIRWRSDNETLMYRDLTYRISDLATEITFCLDQAQRIFRRDLCFDLPDIPTFPLSELEDNWDNKAPSQSFLTDIRNAAIFEGYQDWLPQQIAADPALYDLVMHRSPDHDRSQDRARSTFAQEYEKSVQIFLRHLAILMHKGSGQPGRMKEFVSLRWQNKAAEPVFRNLFVHDGYLLFILSYHKSIHRTHASRYPVRFLLPEVGRLLVQFLVLVRPLRVAFCEQVQIPAKVSEYLWHDGEKIWPREWFTTFGRSTSQRAHGVAVNMSSWRQMAVAIAIKKFGGRDYQADLDVPGDEDDDLAGRSIMDSYGGAMADVFHLQASHSVGTGNRAYGGTINYDRGLTDAGLQEYFKASRLWHQLCRPHTPPAQAGHRRHASSEPTSSFSEPLRRRLALRDRPRRHRFRWGSDQVHFAMRKLFPDHDDVAFRSVHQEQLIDAIVTGCPEIVGVLATGEGKSLGFLLPACLPRAGMTVVIVPLVALKADMVRRCRDAGLSFSVWEHASASTQYQGTPLLFVSMEQAVGSHFRAFLGQQDALELLDRIVFDEAHLVLTAVSYRPKMSLVRQLRQLRCQVVFLTATLPPLMQAQFEARLLLHQPRVIRSRSFRSDITLRIRSSSQPDLNAYLVSVVTRLLQHYRDDPRARLLVYTTTRAAADTLSESLSCPKYYSDSGDPVEKQAASDQWRSGQSKVMVATSAFGVGIDFPSVREIIHMGVPTDMIGFAQEIGRLSRDGQGGFSRVIVPRGWEAETLPNVVDQRRSAAAAMAMLVYLGVNRCLSAVISRFLDGPSQMQYCTQPDPDLRCSKCVQFGFFRPGFEEPDATAWWDASSGHGHERESSDDDGDDDSDDPSPDEEHRGSSTGRSSPVVARRSSPNPMAAGSARLSASMRQIATGRARYERGIQLLRGRCMICMILGQGQLTTMEQMHELPACRHVQRPQFIRAKEQAIERNQSRGGWIKKYTACYHCGQPQDICQVDPGQRRRGPASECEYRDMVFPATWALCQQSRSYGQKLGDISGVSSSIWQHEERWMDWLGTACDLYEMRACQGARMLDRIIQLELRDVFG